MTIHLQVDTSDDEIMRGTRYFVTDDGYKLPIGITSETEETVVAAYLHLCNEHEAEYVTIARAVDAARNRNTKLRDAGSPGRNWPEFRALEKFQRQLARLANLVDT